MTRLSVILAIWVCTVMAHQAWTQEVNYPQLETGGYVKYLGSLFHLDILGQSDTYTGQLIHHRLNTNIKLSPHLTLKTGWRNQLFFGELVERSVGFAENLSARQNDYFNMSWNPVNAEKFLLNTTLDRLYLEWFHGDWEVSLGRQRINWGISNIWNPNDIFNAYSFIDFDYEERPGSDALLVKYYFNETASIEFASRISDNTEEWIFGVLYKWNQELYDFQLLSGYFRESLVLGGGWAGSIGDAGFKGEFSWFAGGSMDNSFTISTEVDYVFSDGTYLSGGYLFNLNGALNASIVDLFVYDISPRNIYPYRHALIFNSSFTLSPLTSAGLTLAYSPSANHQVFAGPLFTYSIAENLDFSFVGQIGFENTDTYGSPFQSYYVRLKWSY